MLPPRLIRRLVLAPLAIVIAIAVAVLFPLLALGTMAFGALTRARPGRRRALRLLYFALIWLVADTTALFMCRGLWLASGFGGRLRTEPYQSRHYAVMRWFLDLMYRGAERTYGLRVEVDEPEFSASEAAARLARPVIVLSRHAGPGDSLLLVHQLLSVYQRRPRVVMKATLQLDPSVDIVGNRVPNVWIRSRQTGESIFTREIERLARGLDQNGALVIFPEGGNWTPHRWRRGIRRLEHQGRSDLAARARDMPNLLPPRPGGTLAAISACPDADVIFVAHAGLDNIVTVGDVWGKFPINQVIRAKWWRVPVDEVPREIDHEGKVQWLYDWWERIDSWISENRPGGATVLEVVTTPEEETAEPVGELLRKAPRNQESRYASTARTRRLSSSEGARSSLAKMPAACLLTDFSVMNSRCAIATLERPSAISASTSRSLGVSRVTGSARERRVISLPTTSGSSTVPPAATVRMAAVNASSLNTRSLSR